MQVSHLKHSLHLTSVRRCVARYLDAKSARTNGEVSEGDGSRAPEVLAVFARSRHVERQIHGGHDGRFRAHADVWAATSRVFEGDRHRAAQLAGLLAKPGVRFRTWLQFYRLCFEHVLNSLFESISQSIAIFLFAQKLTTELANLVCCT